MAGRARSVPSERETIYCSFYEKNGACMHGDSCSRMHVRPHVSRTLLLANLYANPERFVSLLPANVLLFDKATISRNFDEFYIDIYEGLREYGPLEDLLIADNLCEHLAGNVLVRFQSLEDAVAAQASLRGRFYGGRPIDVQFSPVESLPLAICRQLANCSHRLNCNFVHPKIPSREVLDACPLASPEPPERPRPRDDRLRPRHGPEWEWGHPAPRRDDRGRRPPDDDRFHDARPPDETRRDDRLRDEHRLDGPRRDNRFRDDPRRDDRFWEERRRDERRRDDRPRDDGWGDGRREVRGRDDGRRDDRQRDPGRREDRGPDVGRRDDRRHRSDYDRRTDRW